jgi:hypothetical protein
MNVTSYWIKNRVFGNDLILAEEAGSIFPYIILVSLVHFLKLDRTRDNFSIIIEDSVGDVFFEIRSSFLKPNFSDKFLFFLGICIANPALHSPLRLI